MPRKSKSTTHVEVVEIHRLGFELTRLATYLEKQTKPLLSLAMTETELSDYFALAPKMIFGNLDSKNFDGVFQETAWRLFLNLSDNPYMSALLLKNIGTYLSPEQKTIGSFQVRKAVAAVRETYFFTPVYKPLMTFNAELLSFGVVSCNRHHFSLLLQRGAIVTSFAEKPRWNSILTFQHAH